MEDQESIPGPGVDFLSWWCTASNIFHLLKLSMAFTSFEFEGKVFNSLVMGS